MSACAASCAEWVTHKSCAPVPADTHYLIEKQVEGSRTETRVTLLDNAGRENELARILGGESVTEAALLAARDLRMKAER